MFEASPELRPGSNASRRWILGLGIAVVVCAAYVAGRNSRPAAVPDAGRRQVLYYVDPMHPAYRSDRPGKSPDCGMELVPVFADSGSIPPTSAGSVLLKPPQEQALHTEPAQMTSGTHRVHTVGRVTPDETLTYSVSAGIDGWLRRVFSDRTGTQVKRGEALAAFYSKDISAPQQAYIYALDSVERLRRSPSLPADSLALAMQQLATARDNLRFLGMGETQIDELGQTRKEIVDINLAAPADGRILERHVAVGQRFMKGDVLYRIANLQHVWVLADISAADVPLLGAVQEAQIRTEGLPPMSAKVAAVPPQFDEQGRTGRLRIEVNNSSGGLVPGMIVNVDFEVPAPAAITVNVDAVIDTGTAKRVFIATGGGQYEPRLVETGWHDGDRVEIRNGVKPGEKVVTGGAFLLDSESRIKSESQRRGGLAQ